MLYRRQNVRNFVVKNIRKTPGSTVDLVYEYIQLAFLAHLHFSEGELSLYPWRRRPCPILRRRRGVHMQNVRTNVKV